MNFKNLVLSKLENIEQTLSELDYLKNYSIKKDSDKYIINLEPHEGKTGLLTLFLLKDGNVTLGVKQGGNPDLSSMVAEYIVSKHKEETSSVTGTITLSKFNSDDFELFIDYFKTVKCCNIERINNDTPKSILVRISNNRGVCTLTLFSNNTLCIQGKPTLLKLEINQTISLLYPEYSEKLIKENTFYKITMLEEDIEKQLVSMLPKSYNFLKGKLTDYLKQAIVLRRIKLPNLPDYSCKVDTAFVVIEGVLNKILSEELKITYNNFGDIFTEDANTNVFKLKATHKNIIKDKQLATKLENIYNLFNKRRHSLLHFRSPIPTKALIQTEEEADMLFMRCLVIIDETVEAFLESK